MKYLNKVKSSIPVLTEGDVTAHSDKETADINSEYFTTCFNRNIPPLGSGVSPDLDNVYDPMRNSFALLKKSSIC